MLILPKELAILMGLWLVYLEGASAPVIIGNELF